MYEPYDYGEPTDEGGYRVKPYRGPQPREDIISSSRGGGGLKKPSRWVFISRKADIGIVLVLLLSAGLTIMWLISQLPVFVETASYHYQWAKDVYATWGTPSMRWLFINVVVGVIVATSGLLSAFGGSSSAQQTYRSGSGFDKGVSYRGGPDAGVIYGDSEPTYNARATEARFTGSGYESPLYNPYSSEPVSDSREGVWNNHGDDSPPEEMGEREREERHRHRGMHASVDEPVYARPVDPEVMRAARPVSRQGSQRRGMPMPAEDVPMSRDIPREMASDTPPPGDTPREMHSESSREIPRDTPRELPKEMPPVEEPPPPRETPVSREIPVPPGGPDAAEDAPPPAPAPALAPEPEVSEGITRHVVGSRKEDAIEIISKVYDPVPEFEEVVTEHGKFQRLKTDPAIHYAPIEEASAERSPAKSEVLHKAHTFTLGRVIRRDQLADFIEPLSRKLEGIGRKVRDPHKRFDSHSESVNKLRDLPTSPPVAANNSPLVMQAAAIEAGSSAAQPETHRRRLSAEAIPVVAHRRKLSSESLSPKEGTIPHHVKQTSAPVIKHPFASIVSKPSPPSPPLLKQRSIVYPPALLSQASKADESPPPSPPIEKAIPPPPPPHLKLPPSKEADPSSIISSEELPSFKFYIPTSDSQEPGPAAKSSKKQVEKVSFSEDKKPPSGKHSRTPSTHMPSTSAPSTPETGSSSFGQDGQSLMTKPRRSSAGDEKDQEAKQESSPLDKQDSPSGKDDDLHQQIEDFLARFHENWRLQRQESLARYKKRLVELDE